MASWLSDLVRDGALNEILAELNRSADGVGRTTLVERADSLLRVLEKLGNLSRLSQGETHGSGGAAVAGLLTDVLSAEERRTLLNSAAVGHLAGEGVSVENLASLLSTIQRDEVDCRRVVPVQERIVHRVLGRPDHKLAVYGTLVPGGRNHDRVAGLRGTWQRCFVRGRRWSAEDGDPRFRWNPDEPEVDAMLLVSDDLPSAWPALDRFEGGAYRRRLVPARGEEAHHVAYLYESAG